MPLASSIQQLDALISHQAPISEVKPRLDLLQGNVAALEQQVARLEARIQQVESERDLARGMLEDAGLALEAAQEELAAIKGPSTLEPPALRMLQMLLVSDAPCSAEEMAEKLNLDVELVKPHFAALAGRGFIVWAGLTMECSPISSVITAAGRAHAAKAGRA